MERKFYKDSTENYWVLVAIASHRGQKFHILRCVTNEEITDSAFTDDEMKNFTECKQWEIYKNVPERDKDKYKEREKIAARIGIGYICPFCGGQLIWENDFMASEVGIVTPQYNEITDESLIKEIEENEAKMVESKILQCDDSIDIDMVNEALLSDDSIGYTVIYIKTNGKYYEIEDAVVGMYHCANCGKSIETTDCMPSEQSNYPYFKDDE